MPSHAYPFWVDCDAFGALADIASVDLSLMLLPTLLLCCMCRGSIQILVVKAFAYLLIHLLSCNRPLFRLSAAVVLKDCSSLKTLHTFHIVVQHAVQVMLSDWICCKHVRVSAIDVC